jgi:FkbH-like protein
MRIKALRDRGFILGICSKNNPEEVEEVFACRDMPLRLADFAVVETGWDSKNRGLAAIADKLGIGADSLLFVDDNPAEILLIEQTMPGVGTLALPGDPARYCDALDRLHGLDKVFISADDARKSSQYRERAERESSRQAFQDLTGYLRSLGTRISVWTAEARDLTRLHELFTKTNQFNSTTRRYTIGEIEALLRSHDHDVFAFSARDNFGDLGTIGVCVSVRRSAAEVEILSFVMSCRAIGRGIESAVLKQLQQHYLVRGGFRRIVATFERTRKNEPVRRFLEERMIRMPAGRDGGEAFYVLDADSTGDLDTDWIAIDCGIDR